MRKAFDCDKYIFTASSVAKLVLKITKTTSKRDQESGDVKCKQLSRKRIIVTQTAVQNFLHEYARETIINSLFYSCMFFVEFNFTNKSLQTGIM
jgi:hypothetical protein